MEDVELKGLRVEVGELRLNVEEEEGRLVKGVLSDADIHILQTYVLRGCYPYPCWQSEGHEGGMLGSVSPLCLH